MIGEIRDKETAEEAVHAAMTGHIVFSTLHTNSAASALPRFWTLAWSLFNSLHHKRGYGPEAGAGNLQRLPGAVKAGRRDFGNLSKQFHMEKLIAGFNPARRGAGQNQKHKGTEVL